MPRKLNLNPRKLRANVKKSLSKSEVKQDFIGAFAALFWTVPASLLKLSGWSAWGFSFGLTWLMGAVFDVQAWRRSAFAVAATHLIYTKGTKTLADMKIDLWRMGDTATTIQGIRGMSGIGSTLPPMRGGVTGRLAPELTSRSFNRPAPVIPKASLPAETPIPTVSGVTNEMDNEPIGFKNRK